MKQLALGATILGCMAALAGCPVYSNDRYCDGNGCYDCPHGSTPSNGTCVQWACSTSSDCSPGYVCDSSYTCVVDTGGADAGGCGACPSGNICKLSGGVAQCVPLYSSEGGAPEGSVVGEASAPDATRVDAGPDAVADVTTGDVISPAPDAAEAGSTPDGSADGSAPDASPSPDAAPPSVACNATASCGGDGARCVDGRCVAQDALCSDTSQCVTAGAACVDGVCVPHCDVSSPCPAGYACDFTRGVCDLNPTPCAGTGTSSCLGGSVCVEGRCVAPCSRTEAGASCPGGQICVNGGCMPDEAATFACKNDGQGGMLANQCASDEVCLHHDCYLNCEADGGGCSDPNAVCKMVTVAAGTYAVCATATNLGSDCDLAVGRACGTGVCVDGYCK